MVHALNESRTPCSVKGYIEVVEMWFGSHFSSFLFRIPSTWMLLLQILATMLFELQDVGLF